MYKIDSRILGMVGTNCYLLCNMDIKECVLIDPADSQDEISRMIDESGCSLKGILLTHGHFDHAKGINMVLKYMHHVMRRIHLNSHILILVKHMGLSFQ